MPSIHYPKETLIIIKRSNPFPYRKRIRSLLKLMAILLSVTFLIASLTYPEKYRLDYYVSYLGEPLSVSNLDNSLSQLIYRIGIILANICSILIAILYFKQISLLSNIKGSLMLILGIVLLFLFFPLDDGLLEKFHNIGASTPIWILFFNSFTQFVREENNTLTMDTKETRKITFDKWVILISLVPLILYIILWALNIDKWGAIMQKIILIFSILSIFIIDTEDV